MNRGEIMNLKGKRVLLGICGGIAVYKALELVSLLKKSGAEVKVIMTENAAKFVSPLSFQALSQNPVCTDMFEEPKAWEIQHISLAKWADILAIVPATANIIGKIACGIADDMLSTTAMACTAPLFFAPAMNTAMYRSAAVQNNIKTLTERGAVFIGPAAGRLACGDTGEGKLESPEIILDGIYAELFFGSRDFSGKRVLVTAGATSEKIDPVRYITNNSSGKMGIAVAKAAAMRGADVTLVHGRCEVPLPHGVRCIFTLSADDMYDAVIAEAENADVIIKAAAVADYKPEHAEDSKIKKDTIGSIALVKNRDILAELGRRFSGKKILVGFCMETENLESHAAEKLKKKGLDLIAANSLTEQGAGFKTDTNIVTLIDKDGSAEKTPLCSKFDIANIILDRISEKW